MANPNQIIFGQPRKLWVQDAAKALIMSTTPSGRFLVLRAGFVHFQQTSGVAFRAVAGFAFDSTELRTIFEAVAEYVLKHERHLQRGFERAYRKNRLKNPTPAAEVDLRDDRIIVESAGRGVH